MAIDFKPLTITPVTFSLTEGTTIPAPLDSPPRTPIEGKSANTAASTAGADAAAAAAKPDTTTPDSKQQQAPPQSPQSATSSGSQQKRKVNGVRKFFSLRSSSRNDHVHNKLHKDPHNNHLQIAQRKLKAGPPPPAIPELESFAVGMDGGEIGGAELFKDIGKDINVEDLEKSQEAAKSPITESSEKSADEEKKPELPEPSVEKAEVALTEAKVEEVKEAEEAKEIEEPKAEELPKVTEELNPSTTEQVPKAAIVEAEDKPIDDSESDGSEKPVTDLADDKSESHAEAEIVEAKAVEVQPIEPGTVAEPVHTEKADSATNVVVEESAEPKEPVEAPQETAPEPVVEKQVEIPVEVAKPVVPAEEVKEEVVETKEEQS